jgi:hypothetical protein
MSAGLVHRVIFQPRSNLVAPKVEVTFSEPRSSMQIYEYAPSFGSAAMSLERPQTNMRSPPPAFRGPSIAVSIPADAGAANISVQS